MIAPSTLHTVLRPLVKYAAEARHCLTRPRRVRPPGPLWWRRVEQAFAVSAAAVFVGAGGLALWAVARAVAV